MRILIVEDEVKIREGMAKLIGKCTQHSIIGEAKNGKEGIDLSLRYKPDLIITDIQMPQMDGLEMLTLLKELDVRSRTVILTGYSEFDYARKAISLGVKDYLLKPIGPEDVMQLLARIEGEIEKENKMLEGSCESLIRDIIFGSVEEGQEQYEKLVKLMGLQETYCYGLYVGYIGGASVSYRSHFKEWLPALIRRYPEYKCYTFFIETLQQLICLVIGKEDLSEWEQHFVKYMLIPYRKQKEQPAWAVKYFHLLEDLPEAFQIIQQVLTYSLTYGNDELLKETVLNEAIFKKKGHPIYIENSFKIAVCNREFGKISSLAQSFYDYLEKDILSPEDIRNQYIKMVTFISNIIQEIDLKLYERIQAMHLFKRIGEIYTKSEIEQIFEDFLQVIQTTPEKKEEIRNYTILKVINYIREHYNEGITLEEVARKMDLTPEYLSTLFNREMDMNFSSFLKQFRISQAKRLLKGTNLKIYEVAEAVGYSDAKYFMRVFKEVQGISPKEFRQK